MSFTLVTKNLATADVPPVIFTAAFFRRDDGVHFPASMLFDPVSGNPVTYPDDTPVVPAARESETCPAGVATTLGSTGAVGDQLDYIFVVPASTSPGPITIKDGAAGAAKTVFAGGATSVASLVPFMIPWGKKCTAADGWIVTMGANLSGEAFGDFT